MALTNIKINTLTVNVAHFQVNGQTSVQEQHIKNVKKCVRHQKDEPITQLHEIIGWLAS
jgi:hypothetical protein